MIFRFNRYSKKSYFIKLLKENFRAILDENETYDDIVDIILQKNNIKNYKKYIDNMFIEREIDGGMKKVDNEVVKKDNIFGSKICFYPPCLNWVSGDNYCHLHNKDMILLMKQKFNETKV